MPSVPRRFVFRLQPVLEQRERTEQHAQKRVADIERERLRCEETLRGIQAEFLEVRAKLRSRLHRGSAGADETTSPLEGEFGFGGIGGVRQAANASLHLTLEAQRAAMELAGVLKRLEAARAVLLSAAAARKAVQLLKERALEEHRQSLLKQEMADLDELAVMRHGRGENWMTR